MRRVRIYRDAGVGHLSYEKAAAGFAEGAPIDHEEVLAGGWEETTDLFVVPGGLDTPYTELLDGEGTERIRGFVERGGAYLGICAGAYFGAGSIEFEKGHPLEVCGPRELGFFPGKAVGATYGPGKFSYTSEEGACLASVQCGPGDPHLLYFNGGCHFEGAEDHPDVTILGRYADIDGQPAAIVECAVGAGKAILSGVHPEFEVVEEPRRKALWDQLIGSLIGPGRFQGAV